MRETFLSQYGYLGTVIGIGIIIIALFIILRFFKTIFSLSFVGFMGSLCSYFVFDYIFYSFPLVACGALVCSILGFRKQGFIGKTFSILGVIVSMYVILHTFGLF